MIREFWSSICNVFQAIPWKREVLGLLAGCAVIAFAPQISALIAPWGMKAAMAALIKLLGGGACLMSFVSAFIAGPIIDWFRQLMVGGNAQVFAA